MPMFSVARDALDRLGERSDIDQPARYELKLRLLRSFLEAKARINGTTSMKAEEKPLQKTRTSCSTVS